MAMGRSETADWVNPGWQADRREPDTLLAAVVMMTTALWRRRAWIVASAVGTTLLGVAFLAFTDPLYTSKAQVLIEPRPKQVLQTEVVPTGLGSSSVGPDTLLVDSQVEIIRSDAVLGRVVEETNLAADPEFARPSGGGLTSILVGIGRSRAQASVEPGRLQQSPESAALETLRKRLDVKRTGNTYIIDVSVLSERPERAQQLADAIAEAYLADVQDSARESTRQTTEMLSARLDELREDVREAEGKVEAFREEHGLIGAQNLMVNEQQLRDLNDRLTEARTRSSETRVRYERLNRLAEQGVSGVDSITEAIGSDVIADLRRSYGEIVRALSSAETTYGDRHPRVTGLRSERRGIESTIEVELARLARNAEHEYEVARAHEQSLEQRLNQLESVTVGANRALVTMRELEREADAARTVYEAFLNRTKQASEQENLSSNNSRILARAELPYRASYPPAAIVLAAALIFGLMIGSLLAWIRDITARA